MKRSRDFSSSDSELDESTEMDKESADERGTLRTLRGSASQSAVSQLQARKRRRGIIEKRRRDRINHSLSELRRLVPSAFEKQGSAKLEKAEILQMTVDHLKMLHTVGGKGYLDAHALAMDYRGLGFRECLAETARYLSIIEGLDSTDPLRVRLVSHLSSYASQREAHIGLGHAAWGSAFNTPSAHLQHRLLQQGAAPSHSANGSSSVENHAPSRLTCTARDEPGHGPLRVPPSGTIPPLLPVTIKLSPPLLSSLSASTFPFSLSSFPLITTEALSPSATSPTLGKPYRPWSMEIGAF